MSEPTVQENVGRAMRSAARYAYHELRPAKQPVERENVVLALNLYQLVTALNGEQWDEADRLMETIDSE